MFWLKLSFFWVLREIQHQIELQRLRSDVRRYQRCTDPEEKKLRELVLRRILAEGRRRTDQRIAEIEKIAKGFK